jgi:hypothetical protein
VFELCSRRRAVTPGSITADNNIIRGDQQQNNLHGSRIRIESIVVQPLNVILHIHIEPISVVEPINVIPRIQVVRSSFIQHNVIQRIQVVRTSIMIIHHIHSVRRSVIKHKVIICRC